MALQFEARKVALKQDRTGYVLTISIHPDEIPEELLRDFVGSRYGCALVRIQDVIVIFMSWLTQDNFVRVCWMVFKVCGCHACPLALIKSARCFKSDSSSGVMSSRPA